MTGLFRGRKGAEGATTADGNVWSAPVAPTDPADDRLASLLPCSQSGCHLPAWPCSYIDRRFHSCDTAWCVEHGIGVDGRTYCRRHAGVVRALVDPMAAEAPPDVRSRAASLLAWVCRDVEFGVLNALEQVRRPEEELRIEALRLVFKGRGRHRTWQHGWKLAGHVGFSHWAALQVVEDEEDQLVALVDGIQVFKGVPPWIENRRKGLAPDPDEDVAQRAAWYGELTAAMRTELGMGRALGAPQHHHHRD